MPDGADGRGAPAARETDASKVAATEAEVTQAPPIVLSVMLAVPDAPAASAWYRQALGAIELWNLGSVIGLELQGARFFIGLPENNRWESPSVVGTTTTRIEVFVADPDEFVQRAIAAGCDPEHDRVRDHQAPRGVHRQGGFIDPFGHKWLVGDFSPLNRYT
jgi:PhnB protein